MIEFNKVYLDTAPIIYFLDNDLNFGKKVLAIFEEILNCEKRLVTSVLACEEYLVMPYKVNNVEKINAFFEFIADCNIPLYNVDVNVAKKAAKIKADYKDFKTLDALHLACACVHECDLFLTNDKQLRQFREMKCITIEQWMH